jgi:hypothetical protein
MPEETKRTVRVTEAEIDRLSKEDPYTFGMRPCDLEGDDLQVHEWIVVTITRDANGSVCRQEVTDCDRKDC